MFFTFTAWNAGQVPPFLPLQLGWIEGLFRLHPQVLLTAIERFYSTRAPLQGTPNYADPAPPAIQGAPLLANGIAGASPNQRWEHLIYAYIVENTRIFEVFDRVMREYE